MTELLHSTGVKPLTLDQLTIRVKALEKVVITLLTILGIVDDNE